MLQISNLEVSVEGKKVLNGVSARFEKGKLYALMGRNGSGKSTLALTVMGHPRYEVVAGDILLQDESILDWAPDQRAKAGVFLAFQNPVAIPGVSVAQFLRSSIRSVRGHELPAGDLRKLIKSEAQALGIPDSFLTRSLNDGMSGGERKKLETLQLRVLRPRMIFLDETDSGLDVDALKTVCDRIRGLRNDDVTIVVITHYSRMLDELKPDHVLVMDQGRIRNEGTRDLADEIEKNGYESLQSSSVGGYV